MAEKTEFEKLNETYELHMDIQRVIGLTIGISEEINALARQRNIELISEKIAEQETPLPVRDKKSIFSFNQ